MNMYAHIPFVRLIHSWVDKETSQQLTQTSIPSVLRLSEMFTSSPRRRLTRVVLPTPMCPTTIIRMLCIVSFPSFRASSKRWMDLSSIFKISNGTPVYIIDQLCTYTCILSKMMQICKKIMDLKLLRAKQVSVQAISLLFMSAT